MIDLFVKYAPTIATLFFFSVFCYVIFSVFKKGTKKKFDEYAQIPFDKESDEESTKKESNKKL